MTVQHRDEAFHEHWPHCVNTLNSFIHIFDAERHKGDRKLALNKDRNGEMAVHEASKVKLIFLKFTSAVAVGLHVSGRSL